MNISQRLDQLLPPQCVLCHGPASHQTMVCGPCWEDLLVCLPSCGLCGRELGRGGGCGGCGRVCAKCLGKEKALDGTTTLMPYNFPTAQLILSLKYKNQLYLAHEFGQRLPMPDCLIPVPLHPLRLFARGYNQALEITRSLGANLSVPVDYRLVKRSRNTRAQFRLNSSQRQKNIRGAFKVGAAFAAKSVVVVDDIVTTGNTANELARELKRAGAEDVQLWACAHADLDH